MILFSKELIKFEKTDLICLEQEEGLGYFYLTRAIYDQCLLLADRLEGNTTMLRSSLEANGKHPEAMEYFTAHAPKPLNILAPFIGLIRVDYVINEDLEQIGGILHALSKLIDFDKYSTVPKAVRANVSFSKLDLERYKEDWASMLTAYKISDVDISDIPTELIRKVLTEVLGGISLPMIQPTTTTPTVTQVSGVVQQPTTSVNTGSSQEVTTSEEDDDRDSELDDLFASLDAMMGETLETITASDKVPDMSAPAPTPAPAPAPTVTSEVSTGYEIPESAVTSEQDREKQEVEDILRAMGGIL